jgi:hypothetical protein
MRIYYTHLCGKYQGRSWCGSSTSQLLVRATPKPMHQHVFMTCISALLRLHTWQTDVHAIYVSTIAFFAKLHSISELGWHPHKHGVANTHTHTNVIITAPVQPLASIFCTNKSHMCTHVHAQSHVSSTFGSQDLSFSSQHVPGLLRAHKRRSISAPTARHAWQFGTHVHTIRMHVHTKYHVSSTMFSYTCIYSTCTASVAHTCRAHHDHAHPLSAPLASIFHQQTRIAGVYKHAKCESSRMPGSKVDFFLSVCVFGTLSTQHRAQKHGHLCHQRTCRHALEHTCVQSICAPSCPHSAAQNGLGAESSRELLCAVPKRLDWVGQSCTLRFVSPLPL